MQALILSALNARAAEVANHSKKQSSSSSSSSSSATSADIYKESFKEGTLRVSKGEGPMKVSNDLRRKFGEEAVSSTTLYRHRGKKDVAGHTPPRRGREPLVPTESTMEAHV